MIDSDNIFKKDGFNSEVLGKPAFVLASVEKFRHDRLAALPRNAFVTAKVKSNDIAGIMKLEQCGFFLVDTNLRFEKKLDGIHGREDHCPEVMAATEAERHAIVTLAAEAFSCSRFFLDPMIPDSIARASRSKWVDNYFEGLRGDGMLAVREKDSVAGFCLLLRQGNDAVIDLIAVAPQFRRRGLAGKLIRSISAFMPGIEKIIVGTQAANIPAVRVYEDNGFRLADSSYVFHYHGERSC